MVHGPRAVCQRGYRDYIVTRPTIECDSARPSCRGNFRPRRYSPRRHGDTEANSTLGRVTAITRIHSELLFLSVLIRAFLTHSHRGATRRAGLRVSVPPCLRGE